MNRLRVAGSLVTICGLAAYLVGATEPYPGRALSVSAVMVGLTLVALGGFE